MKECQKFIQKYKKVDPLSIREKYIIMTTWKAALEWVCNNPCKKEWEVGDVVYLIKQELEEE